MIKKFLKVIAIIMSLLSMLSLFSCTSTKEQIKKDNEKVIEFLNKKYNKEFEISGGVHKFGGSDKPSKAKIGVAYCVESPNKTFNVFLHDDGTYSDNYQDITMIPYAQVYYEKSFRMKWSNCGILTKIISKGTENEIYTKENIEAFLTNEGVSSNISIFIHDSNSTEKEAEKIYLFSKEMKDMGLHGSFLYIYVTESINIDSKGMEDIEKGFRDYIKNGVIVKCCEVSIDENNELNIEKIKKDLENKNV